MLTRRFLAIGAALSAALVVAGSATAAKPNPPGVPDLDASSDSGLSATDNVTNDTTPDFTIPVSPGYAGYTVKLYFRDRSDESNVPIQVGSATASSAGLAKITVSPAVVQGSYEVTARVVNSSLEESGFSAMTIVGIDTEAPRVDIAPLLYDLVISNQTTLATFTQFPRFLVIVEPGTTVTLWEGTNEVGTGTSAQSSGTSQGGAGFAFVRATTALLDGLHTVYATVVDIAGNPGVAASPTTTFLVDTLPPPVSKPRLVQDALATGEISTKSPRPTIEVDSEAGARITVYENGVALGAAVADLTGLATVKINETRWLDPGVHCVYAIGIDVNTNDSPEGPQQCITVEPGIPPFTSNLGVDLTEDYLTLSLTSTLAARATIQIHRGSSLVKVVRQKLTARGTKRIRVRVAGKGLVRVVASVKAKDGRAIVLRRTARR